MSSRSSLATRLFPIGTASGAAFCNRVAERKQLTKNILNGTHTYIIGMRRYGKTSLIENVLKDLSRRRTPRVHTASIDLFTVHSIEGLDALLRKAIGILSAEFLPKNRAVLGHLGKIFSAFKPELTVRDDGWSLRLFSGHASSATLQELLMALDEAAKKYKRRVVLVMDEFQQIAEIDKQYSIEGAIRHVAQHAENLSFVYLGSERTTIEAMFTGTKRPLYNSGCLRLDLERIGAADYIEYLQEASRLQWHRELSDKAVKEITSLTDCHANYVNLLCRELWQLRRPPSASIVRKTWNNILTRDRHHAQSVLMALSNGQRAALQAFATAPTAEPTSKDYLQRFGLAASSMSQFLAVLVEKDFVRKRTDNSEYEVVDPLIRDLLRLSADDESG